jgi:hypothetical protein
MSNIYRRFIFAVSCIFYSGILVSAQSKFITENAFQNCIELSNASVRVVLEPNVGGRVLKYEINGNNILYVDSLQNGLSFSLEKLAHRISAGRFDIGPYRITPEHYILWQGEWDAVITGSHSARFISQVDTATGVQLIRDFILDSLTSKFSCTQTIRNISSENKRYCFWSRTFVRGGGKTIVPLNPHSRFPMQYIAYGNNKDLLFKPEVESNLLITENQFVLSETAKYNKYEMDGEQGWMAYISTDSLLFFKQYKVFPDSVYGEMTGCTASVWFYKDEIVEIEPIGPWQWVSPGEEVSFTEHWYLFDISEFKESKTLTNQIFNNLNTKSWLR